MNNGAPIRLRPGMAPGTAWALLFAGAACGAAMQYLWLFSGQPMLLRIWGFGLLPAYLVPLPFLFALVRIDLSSFGNIAALGGSPLRWLLGVLLVLLSFGSAVGLHWLSGGKLDPGWKWITLGSSALLDLPLVLLFTLPMIVVQELFWRSTVSQLLEGQGVLVRVLVSALFWTAGQGVLLWRCAADAEPLFAVSLGALAFSTGVFAAMLHGRSGVLLSGFGVLASVTFAILLFGTSILELNNLLYGYDVASFDALFPAKLPGREGYAFCISAVLLVPSLLFSLRKK